MKFISFSLITLSIVLIISNLVDEIDGSVIVRTQRNHSKIYTMKESPKDFQKAITLHWNLYPLPGMAGCFILWLMRRIDRLDPTSSHFQGSHALDELGEYLDRELEKKKR